jgi:hypothetical protein
MSDEDGHLGFGGVMTAVATGPGLDDFEHGASIKPVGSCHSYRGRMSLT